MDFETNFRFSLSVYQSWPKMITILALCFGHGPKKRSHVAFGLFGHPGFLSDQEMQWSAAFKKMESTMEDPARFCFLELVNPWPLEQSQVTLSQPKD